MIIEEKVDKNKDINSILNVNKNGVYTIKIVADETVSFATICISSMLGFEKMLLQLLLWFFPGKASERRIL